MENISISSENKSKTLIENEFENLSISAQSESYLMTTAKWSKFLAILSFIMIGIMVIFGVGFAGLSGVMSDYQQPSIPMVGMMSYLWIFYILLGLLYFFPTYYLLLFANKTKQAIVDKNPVMLEEGFRNMKRSAKFVGIMMIVIIAMYILAIIAISIGAVLNGKPI